MADHNHALNQTNRLVQNPVFKGFLAPAVPYFAVGIGLLLLKNVWAAILLYHFCILAVLLTGRVELADRMSPGFHRLLLIPVVLLPLAGGVLLIIVWPWLGVAENINVYLNGIGLKGDSWPVFIMYFVAFNPFLEELFWRKYLKNDSKIPVPADAWFSGYHLLVLAGKIDLLWLAPVFVLLCGTAWFWRQVGRHGIMISILSHLSGDISVILAIYLMIGN